MASFVLLAGLVAFIVSSLLLKVGTESMALRYAAGLFFGYLTLCLSLWLWTGSHPKHIASDLDANEMSKNSQSAHSSSKVDYVDAANVLPTSIMDLEFLLLFVLLGGTFWLIYAAPTLMAELTLDSVISVQIYQRLRRADVQPYLYTFWQLTRWSLFFTGLVVVGGAWLLQHWVPNALTLGDVLRQSF
ncbi:hypothetical protein HYN46_15940 [Aquirhabdus parva]|uniref:Uncharacterized protein n=2 Tax=Aquirhabdus parva TaxID=2283318 RepID=A0A345PA91_9GAMM|nr:hypothetical protein HYN46_15940 [Aquirhabdus parva]